MFYLISGCREALELGDGGLARMINGEQLELGSPLEENLGDGGLAQMVNGGGDLPRCTRPCHGLLIHS
jgi:hypothetical protein